MCGCLSLLENSKKLCDDGDFRHYANVDSQVEWYIFHFNFIGFHCFQDIEEMAFPVEKYSSQPDSFVQ